MKVVLRTRATTIDLGRLNHSRIRRISSPSPKRRTAVKVLALAAMLTAAVSTTASAGPPWITVEVRPFGANLVVVHTFHHGTPNPLRLRGSAEGLVNGRRESVPLRFELLAEASNTYGVAKTWGDSGVWVLSIETAENDHFAAATAVMIDGNGNATVSFPRQYDGQTRAASGAEVTAMLGALSAGTRPPRLFDSGWWRMAMRLAAPLFALVLVVFTAAKLVGAVAARIRSTRVVAKAASPLPGARGTLLYQEGE